MMDIATGVLSLLLKMVAAPALGGTLLWLAFPGDVAWWRVVVATAGVSYAIFGAVIAGVEQANTWAWRCAVKDGILDARKEPRV
jgi:hypothetical protein